MLQPIPNEAPQPSEAEAHEERAPVAAVDPGWRAGQKLAQARLRRGWSLDEVAERIRVRREFLEALEDMNMKLLPGRAYALAFLRSYVRELGLDERAIVEQFAPKLVRDIDMTPEQHAVLIDAPLALIDGTALPPLVAARAAGGGLSRTAEGDMVINAAAGLGSVVAQGEVVPDRYLLDRSGRLKQSAVGRKYHAVGCAHGRRIFPTNVSTPCVNEKEVRQLGRLMRKAEALMQGPIEIEWALDERGRLEPGPLAQSLCPVGRTMHQGRHHLP